MAKPSKLKVFRTAIGFHDAYVAAPSQKAALEAWGADANLFARGIAEPVNDPALAAPALAQPGVVLKVLRGTKAEQLAALGKPEPAGKKTLPRAVAVKPKTGPRPNRDALDKTEAALDELAADHRQAADALAREEAALQRHRTTVEQKQERDRAAMEKTRDRQQAAYDRALAKWRAG